MNWDETDNTVKGIGYGNKCYNQNEYKLKPFLGKEIAYIEWTVGGQSGGSCWDDGTEDRHRPVTGEPEPSFDAFDELLYRKMPDLTFLEYKKISKTLIHEIDWTDREYYGNYYEKRVKFIVIEEVDAAIDEIRRNRAEK